MRGVSWTRAFGLRASLTFYLTLTLASLVARRTHAQCSNKPDRDCDFYFDGYRGSIFTLTSGNDYTTTKIQHKNGSVGYSRLDGAPCKTSGSDRGLKYGLMWFAVQPDNCKHMTVKTGARPPVKSTSAVTLRDRASSTIKAVQGKCFQLYFGEIFVKLGNGPSIQLDWDSDLGVQFFPKAKRCVVVRVA